MSPTSTTPMPNAQRRRMRSSSSARLSAVSFLESSRPPGRGLHRTTAAATTGPASGPRPASSTPTTSSPAANEAVKSREGVPESMRKFKPVATALSPLALLIASGCAAQSGDSPAANTPVGPSKVAAQGSFDNAWAIAFAPGTQTVFVTEKPGTMKFVDLPSGRIGTVTGVPQVAVGGQGGLADVAFLASEASPTLSRRTIYLSWAQAGEGNLRGGVVGRGTLVCEQADTCRID